MIEIVDQSNTDLYSQNQDLINNFADYSSKNLDFDKPVKVYFMDDVENAKDPLGKTAYYDPDKMEIKIYITGRHLKDILRSISHELIHHVQNCRGDFGSLNQTSPGYAQEDDHLRGMEHEAYTMGNIMNFRDFEDNYKKPGANTMSEQKINKLRALVRKGVKQVLSEQEESPVPLGTSAAERNTVGLEKQTVINISKCINPRSVGQYISSQLNSWNIGTNEFKLMLLGIKSCSEKKTLQEVPSGTFGMTKASNLNNLLTYIESNSTAFGPSQSDSKKKIIQIIKNYSTGTMSTDPIGTMSTDPSSGKSLKCVNECPKGSAATATSTAEFPFGACKQGEKIIARLCDPDVPLAANRGPAKKKSRYRKCDEPPFSKGCSGQKVKDVQALLFKALGGNLNKLEEQRAQKTPEQRFADGKFWSRTEEAVKEFQRKARFPKEEVTGIIDQKTLEAIKTAANSAAQPAAQASPAAPAKPADARADALAAAPADVAAATLASPAPAQPAAAKASTAAPAKPVAAQKYTGVRPGSRLERAIDQVQDQSSYPENKRKPYHTTGIWSRRDRLLGVGASPAQRDELAKVLKAALLKKGYLEKPYDPNLTNESLTIEQKKLTEAKSLFERLKKVL